MLIAVIAFAAGMLCAFLLAGLCTAAHDADVQSEVLDAADRGATTTSPPARSAASAASRYSRSYHA